MRKFLFIATGIILAIALAVIFRRHGPNLIIYAESDRSGNSEIYRINLRTGRWENLTNNPAYDGYPAVSPDGAKLAFVSNRSGQFALYLMTLGESTGIVPLENTSKGDNFSPVWSPDSETIFFVSDRSLNQNENRRRQFDLFSLNLPKKNIHQWTDTTSTEISPMVAPNNEYVVFVKTDLNRSATELFRLDITGKQQMGLQTLDTEGEFPAFFSAGILAYIKSTHDGSSVVTRDHITNLETEIYHSKYPMEQLGYSTSSQRPFVLEKENGVATLVLLQSSKKTAQKFYLSGLKRVSL